MRRKDGSWEEDIECVVDPRQGKGGIFLSNIEAASNPQTLQRTHNLTQACRSAL